MKKLEQSALNVLSHNARGRETSKTTLTTNGGSTQQNKVINQIQQQNSSTSSGNTLPAQIVNDLRKKAGLVLGSAGAETHECKDLSSSIANQLPLGIRLWLEDTARAELQSVSVGMKEIKMPNLSDEERKQLQDVYDIMQKVFKPSYENGDELTSVLFQLFSSFRGGLSFDPGQQELKIDAWLSSLEKYPLWAIKSAAVSAREKLTKEPPLSDFITAVKARLGNGYHAMKMIESNKYEM